MVISLYSISSHVLSSGPVCNLDFFFQIEDHFHELQVLEASAKPAYLVVQAFQMNL